MNNSKSSYLILEIRLMFFDKNIIDLLNNRKGIVEQIANFKHENKLTIFQIERWFGILKTRKEKCKVIGIRRTNGRRNFYFNS